MFGLCHGLRCHEDHIEWSSDSIYVSCSVCHRCTAGVPFASRLLYAPPIAHKPFWWMRLRRKVYAKVPQRQPPRVTIKRPAVIYLMEKKS